MPDDEKPQNFVTSNQGLAKAVRGDGPLIWTASNPITRKLTREGSPTALGWATEVAGKRWYGRVRDERGNWTFGPSSLSRARKAVEAWLRHEPFEREEDEAMWAGDLGRILVGRDLYRRPANQIDGSTTAAP